VPKLVLAAAAAAVFASTTSLVGCKSPGSAKLEGHWRGTRADGVDAAAQSAANTFATQTEITSRGNLITVSTPQSKGQLGTYMVDEENKTTVVLHTDKDGPASLETFSFNEDGKTMVWRLGEGRSIVFEKIKD
jgi:hypothetical protein